MALSYIGGDTDDLADGGDASATLPGGIAQNDIVIAAFAVGLTSDINMVMVTSGYTEVADLYSNDTSDINFFLGYKVQGATPDSTAVCEGGGNAASGVAIAVHVWRGFDLGTPLDATTTTATGIDTAIPNPPAITTVTANAVAIVAGGSSILDATWTVPSGYSNGLSAARTDTNRASVGIASKVVASPASEDPGVWSDISPDVPTHSWAAATLALRPAGAAGSNKLAGFYHHRHHNLAA